VAIKGENGMKVDDDNLIHQLKKKNPKALDYLVDRYSNLIFKVAYSVLRSKEESEECLNDALLKIWNSMDSFNKDKSKFVTWIIIITKYTAIDYLRKEKKHKANVSIEDIEINDNFDLENEILSRDFFIKVLNDIKNMDKENREIFIRRFFLMESIKDISEKMVITESAVANRLLRGKRKLISMYKEDIS